MDNSKVYQTLLKISLGDPQRRIWQCNLWHLYGAILLYIISLLTLLYTVTLLITIDDLNCIFIILIYHHLWVLSWWITLRYFKISWIPSLGDLQKRIRQCRPNLWQLHEDILLCNISLSNNEVMGGPTQVVTVETMWVLSWWIKVFQTQLSDHL